MVNRPDSADGGTVARILLIDDQEPRRQGLVCLLAPPHEIISAQPEEDAAVLELVHRHRPRLLLLALKLERRSGLALLEAARKASPNLPAILLAANEEEAKAQRAQLDESGADCLVGPLTVPELHAAVRRALSKRPKPEPVAFAFEGLVGSSQAMRQLVRLILRIAAVPGPVLLVGERGTGKETVIRRIHQIRQRKLDLQGELEVIPCVEMSGSRLERLLFGFMPGAIPHARGEQAGLFDQAQGSAVYLNGIEAVPHWLQTRILRVLEEQRTQRLGEDQRRPSETGFFASTPPSGLAGLLPDLYYLIGTNEIRLPPLRSRLEDIPELANHFLAAQPAGQGPIRCAAETMEALQNYSWPGNVAELKHAIGLAARVCTDDLIRLDDLPEPIVREVRRRSAGWRLVPGSAG
jgi:DNA-binding NtrC family response regulator